MHEEFVTRKDLCVVSDALRQLADAYIDRSKRQKDNVDAERNRGYADGLVLAAIHLREYADDMRTLSQFQLSLRQEANIVRNEP